MKILEYLFKDHQINIDFLFLQKNFLNIVLLQVIRKYN